MGPVDLRLPLLPLRAQKPPQVFGYRAKSTPAAAHERSRLVIIHGNLEFLCAPLYDVGSAFYTLGARSEGPCGWHLLP